MEPQTTAPIAGAARDVYASVTDKIIEHLGKGTVPWQKPWRDGGTPRNLITQRPYRGINLILLGMEGYDHNLFLTFDQARNIGAKVMRGAKGHMVVYWHKPDQKEEAVLAEEREHSNDTGKPKAFLQYYTVFNIAQCENIPERLVPSERATEILTPCEEIIKGMPNAPTIQHKEAKAYYEVVQDIINMPKKKSFKADTAYYATLFHELVHSTGHDSRCARKGVVEMAEFAGELYSKEELVAEIGACLLCSVSGIAPDFKNSTAYIQGWLKKLQDDKRLIVWAASLAQQATDYILNVKAEDKTVVEAQG
jgi:antirestriction protein ArdC